MTALAPAFWAFLTLSMKEASAALNRQGAMEGISKRRVLVSWILS